MLNDENEHLELKSVFQKENADIFSFYLIQPTWYEFSPIQILKNSPVAMLLLSWIEFITNTRCVRLNIPLFNPTHLV